MKSTITEKDKLLQYSIKSYSHSYIISYAFEPLDELNIQDCAYDNENVNCDGHFILTTEFNIDSDSDFFNKNRQFKRLHQEELFNSYSDIEVDYYDGDDDDYDDAVIATKFEVPFNIMPNNKNASLIDYSNALRVIFNSLKSSIPRIIQNAQYGYTLNESIGSFKFLSIRDNNNTYENNRINSNYELLNKNSDSRKSTFSRRKFEKSIDEYESSNNYNQNYYFRSLTERKSKPFRILNENNEYSSNALSKQIVALISSRSKPVTSFGMFSSNYYVESSYPESQSMTLIPSRNKPVTAFGMLSSNYYVDSVYPERQSMTLIPSRNKPVTSFGMLSSNYYVDSVYPERQSMTLIPSRSKPVTSFGMLSSNYYVDSVYPERQSMTLIPSRSKPVTEFGMHSNNYVESTYPERQPITLISSKNKPVTLFGMHSNNHYSSVYPDIQSMNLISSRIKKGGLFNSHNFRENSNMDNDIQNFRLNISTWRNKFSMKQSSLWRSRELENINLLNQLSDVTITRDNRIIRNSSNIDVNVIKIKTQKSIYSKEHASANPILSSSEFTKLCDFITANAIVKNKKYSSSLTKNNIIPLKVYTCWHTETLPPKMLQNYNYFISNNPELEFTLFDEIKCRKFISRYFDKSVLNAYDSLIPSSYKSDLWRFCVLHKKGGIYIDVKYNCVNDFKLIDLCTKEHFTMERKNIEWGPNNFGIYTALIAVKPYNKIIGKCIKRIVKNVSDKYYGFNALYPTGPGLLGTIYFSENAIDNVIENVDTFFGENQRQIIYKNTSVLEVYPEYRNEQLAHQNNLHYSTLWETSNIYKLFIDHRIKRDFSALNNSSKKSVLVICHIGNFDVFEKMRHYVSFVNGINGDYNVDLFFNLIQDITSSDIVKLNTYFPEANVTVSDNYGFDIGSFYHILNVIKEKNVNYDYVLKIHTKSDDVKRFNVINSITSSPEKIMEILKNLDNHPEIGCVSSKESFQTDDFIERTRNKNHLNALLSEFGLRENKNKPFPAGSMFWIRFDILKEVYMKKDLLKICQSLNTDYTFDYNWFYFAHYQLVNKIKSPSALSEYWSRNRNLAKNLFEAVDMNLPSQNLRDGMIEHAHERMIAYAVDFCNKKIVVV